MLHFETATELAGKIRRREISAEELMQAHLERIEAVNPTLNAIVTLLPERALAGARSADAALARGEEVGILHGLPIAHKDLADTQGIRTTYGSPIFADHVPDRSTLLVERTQAAGAITIGKTNTPEFGAGSQTFNPVFGVTKNPYDVTKTCGGSSGGAAVALASGMQPLADGSDMGGSLRNPAAFCNVVGLRPSPGRVPSYPTQTGWATLGVAGPMARTVEDVALFMAAIAGYDARVPIAIRESAESFTQPLQRNFTKTRVAWSRDLGGLPIDPRITDVLEKHRPIFQQLGCQVEDSEPDLTDSDDCFKVGRAFSFSTNFAPLLEEHRLQLKQTVIWNTEMGMGLSSADFSTAAIKRTALFQRVHDFMQAYEFLICPVTQVPPFDITQEFITEINGVQMETYIDWMQSCYLISTLGLPAISVPCGFTDDGLPVGIQIVGRYQEEFSVLQLAYAFQEATHYWKQHPAI